MSSSTLLERTLHLVRTRQQQETYASIADASGLSAHWVKLFARGGIADPSVNKVERLYNYLNDEPLNLEG